MQFNKLYNFILESLEQYQPPYNEQQMRQNGYSQDIIEKLKHDPAHGWRMKTGLELIHRQPTKTQLMRIWKNWQRMTDDQKIMSDQKCIELFGCTNEELYNFLIPQYKVDRPSKNEVKYPVKEEVSDIPQINSPEDLKEFYKDCKYSLIDGVPDNETDWEQDWRLLSTDQILKNKVGICYDTAIMDNEFLTKWGIKHLLLFGQTKRSLSDDYNDDPTHMFNVYYDQKEKCWKWLEGSWGDFKDNDWKQSNLDTLIKNIGKALANDQGQIYLISVITKVPHPGMNMREFHHYMKKEIMNPQYEILPDIIKEDRDLLTLNPAVIANISNDLVYHASPYDLDQLKGETTSDWSGEKGSVFVTPLKGIAACFLIDKNDILGDIEQKYGIQINNCNFSYKIWNQPVEKLQQIPDIVEVVVEPYQKIDLTNFEKIYGKSSGYLYTIDFSKYKNNCHMFNKNINSDVQFVIQGDVDYIKKEKITIKWSCEINEKI